MSLEIGVRYRERRLTRDDDSRRTFRTVSYKMGERLGMAVTVPHLDMVALVLLGLIFGLHMETEIADTGAV